MIVRVDNIGPGLGCGKMFREAILFFYPNLQALAVRLNIGSQRKETENENSIEPTHVGCHYKRASFNSLSAA